MKREWPSSQAAFDEMQLRSLPITTVPHTCGTAAQHSQALLDYSRAVELVPHDLWARISRGQLYVELKQPEKAVEDLNRALQMLNAVPNVREQNWSESQAYARNGLGMARAMLGDFRSAFREFDLSIDLQPENGWVYFNRAQARKRMGDKAATLADDKKSLSRSEPKLAAFKREFAETKKFENSVFRLEIKTCAHRP
jgi:tetratricopeptide (TPR) repeat protein